MMHVPGSQAVLENSPARVCGERIRLSSELLQAVRDIVALQNQQTKAVMTGDDDFTRFDLLLHMATERKRQAKYALLQHIQNHSC